jgi:hypothetical protein
MTKTGLARRWQPRGIARVAVILMVLAATGIAAGAGATAARHTATVSRVSLAYVCAFPAGPRPVSVLAQATFPATGTAGRPIRPIAAGVTVTLPHPAVASLARLRAAKVSAVARLSTVVTERGRSVRMVWPGLAAPEAQLPAKGSLAFTASGPVPPVTVAVPGDVTFTAAGLSLVFTPRPASNAAVPLGLQVGCTVKPGQDAALAALPVSAAPSASVPQHSGPARTTGPGTNFCPELKKALKLNPRFPLPKPPPGSHVLHSAGLPSYCVYADGYSDVLKLKGSAFLGPGLSNISPFLNSIFNFNPPKVNYFQQDSAAELSFHGQREFPPAKSTFLAFGFVPATATMHLMELGTINIVTLGAAAPTQCKNPCPTITTVYSRLFLRIDGVTINGVPLAVGPHCQTPGFDVILKGSSATNPPYSFTAGGPLTGTVTIPHFAGCGVGENVDAIFNASISGPGNFTLLTQGVVCQQGPSPIGCPPKVPKPLRQVTG